MVCSISTYKKLFFRTLKKIVYYLKIDLNILVFKVMVFLKLYGTRKRARKKRKEKHFFGFLESKHGVFCLNCSLAWCSCMENIDHVRSYRHFFYFQCDGSMSSLILSF